MKQLIRILSFALILSMGLSGIAGAASGTEAAPCSSEYIESAIASISKSGNTLYVTFTVLGTGTMTTLGASSVKIYTSGGSLVKTFWGSSTPSLQGSNQKSYTGSVSYEGTSGTTYYAVVTAYAKNSSGSDTLKRTTASITL